MKQLLYMVCLLILAGGYVYSAPGNSGNPDVLLGELLCSGEVAGPEFYDPHSEAGVTKTRFVKIDMDAFAPVDSFAEKNYILTLALFKGAVYNMVIDKVEETSGGFVYSGYIQGTPHNPVFLARRGDVLLGNITVPGGHYRIRYASGYTHVVQEVDYGAYPSEYPPIPVASPAKNQAVAPVRTPSASSPIIDVLVVYTAAARSGQGGTSAMETLIDLAITETNTGYSNSDVSQRLRLVHSAEVTYDETSFSWSTTLSRLRNTSDGYMDDAHTLRDTYGADEVVLLVNNTGSCGIAYVMQSVSSSFDSSAFAVVARTCATGYYSFGHELGHNMGCAHDRANASVLGAYTYSYGYQDPSQAFRTCMAYNCSPSCTRVLYWSNPDVDYGGSPMGVLYTDPAAADNHRSLNASGSTVAAFRDTAVTGSDDYYIFHGSNHDSNGSVTMGDFDGDGNSDIAIFRASTGRWCVRGSASVGWGTSTDIPVPGDYDGDGDTDIAIYRPSTGRWCVQGSASVAWGTSTDIPVPGDYNGDGTTQIAVYRPSNGRWCIRGQASIAWGVSGDVPVPGDYDGDGDTDIAIYRPSTGRWCVMGSASVGWGTSTDIPVPGDYDGDGDTDIAIYRPSNGRWCVMGNASVAWGTSTDIPVPGDYDGDDDTDIAIFRPSNGRWCVMGSASVAWGISTDVPLFSHKKN
ncbi:MAG: hypothetical protein GY765_16500 [bacterium]|nr:hypothetical protein [bacterium]